MYSVKENFLRTLRGDNPDRLVVQWGPLEPVMGDPCGAFARGNRVKGKTTYDKWGTRIDWPEDQPAAMPHVTDEIKVVKDITCWRDQVKVPDLRGNASTGWEEIEARVAAIDRNEKMVMGFMGTGMFEQLHYLMGFEDTLANFLEEPEAMHDLLDAVFQYRYDYADLLIKGMKPDAILSHDDWGAKTRLFMSPEIWREFFKERYRKFYKLFRDNGVLVIHHADSHCEDIVEDMEEIGIDIWQGVLPQNNIPAIQKRLKGTMTLMGGLDSAIIDRRDTSEEIIRKEVRRACDEYAPGGHFIPCLTSGLKNSALFPGVDATIDDEIAKYSKNFFPY